MKTTLLGFAAVAFFAIAPIASAQMMGGYGSQGGYGMMGGYEATGSQATTTSADAGGAAGAAILTKLQSKQLSCNQLTTNDFAALGDYYMGQMMGSYHDQMDQYMSQSLGEQGDEQMHIALGERLSGCNTTAAHPAGTNGYFPMMMGGWGQTLGYGAPFGYGQMLGGYGYWLNELLSIALWFFVIIGVVATVRWAIGKRNRK